MCKRPHGEVEGACVPAPACSTDADVEPPVVSLPEDVLSAIFSHLSVSDRARASRLCRRWRVAALQPPYSTSLILSVLLTDDLQERGGLRVVLPEAAAALLRGPLCAGLQRIRLDLVFPGERRSRSYASAADNDGPSVPAAAFGTVGAALPQTLRALSLDPARRRLSSAWWRAALAALDLPRTAPRLEDLELRDRESSHAPFAPLAGLDLGHPSLRRLGAHVRAGEWSELEPALRRLPRLEALGLVDVAAGASSEADGDLAALAAAGVRAERLHVAQSTLGVAHTRLLRVGCVLSLESGTPPARWALPAGLAELRLKDFELSPALLTFLLSSTSTYAPSLGCLVVDKSCIENVSPEELLASLAAVPGGTQAQIEVGLPDNMQELAPLARALAASPILQEHFHVDLRQNSRLRLYCMPAAVITDFDTYRRARAAALRGMGERGRQLLVLQGYGSVA